LSVKNISGFVFHDDGLWSRSVVLPLDWHRTKSYYLYKKNHKLSQCIFIKCSLERYSSTNPIVNRLQVPVTASCLDDSSWHLSRKHLVTCAAIFLFTRIRRMSYLNS
jgi:hypothetical protein